MATLAQRVGMLRGLISNDVARAGPFFVDVDLTGRCSLQCVGCLYHSPYLEEGPPGQQAARDLPVDLFERLCQELGAMGTHNLILQGTGEPLLHPDLPGLIRIAKSLGLHVELITNGTLLSRDRAEALLDSGLDHLKVSLWASSPEQYRLNYPGADPDYFHRIVEALGLVATLKAERGSSLPKLAVYQPLNRYNFQTIASMVDLAVSTGCNALLFAPLGSALGELASLSLSAEEDRLVRASLLQARQRLDSLGVQHNIDHALLRYDLGRDVWRTLPCYITWLHARIRVDGTVQPCGRCDATVDFGNVGERPFPEIWNGSAIRAFRRQAMTVEGLASLGGRCDCNFCCYVADNMQVHRVFRWFVPFVRPPIPGSRGR